MPNKTNIKSYQYTKLKRFMYAWTSNSHISIHSVTHMIENWELKLNAWATKVKV